MSNPLLTPLKADNTSASVVGFALRVTGACALIGFFLTVLAILLFVFVFHIRLNLQTGIHFVDSMLYSMGNPIAVIIVAFIWGVCGAAIGCVLGGLVGTIRAIAKRY